MEQRRASSHHKPKFCVKSHRTKGEQATVSQSFFCTHLHSTVRNRDYERSSQSTGSERMVD